MHTLTRFVVNFICKDYLDVIFPIINSHLKHTDLIGLSSLLSTGMDLTGSSRVSSCP